VVITSNLELAFLSTNSGFSIVNHPLPKTFQNKSAKQVNCFKLSAALLIHSNKIFFISWFFFIYYIE